MSDAANPESIRDRGGAIAVRALPVFALSVGVVFTAAVVLFAWRHSYFFGDDYGAFHVAKTRPLLRALVASNGGQIVPLERALMFSSWGVAPMNFAVALSVLTAFHLLGVIYLYRTLQLLGRTRLNAAVVAAYATYAFTGVNFVWFSSGAARFPYVAFALIAVYEYVAYARSGERWRLVAVCAAYVAALGFYGKAILIPLYCVGLDLVAPAVRVGSVKDRLKWWVSGALSFVSVVYVIAFRAVAKDGFGRVNGDWRFQVGFLKNAWKVFGNSLFGRVLELGEFDGGSWPVFVACFMFCAYTVWCVRRSLVAWIVAALLMSANFLVVGMSSRTLALGSAMVFEYRHYFELTFLLALFGGVVVQGVRASSPDVWWLVDAPWRANAAACLLGAALVGNAIVAYRSGARIHELYYADASQSRAYMRNLEGDLASLRISETPAAIFEIDPIPAFLDRWGFDFVWIPQLFEVMHVHVRFAQRGMAHYRVDPSGHIAQLSVRAGRGRPRRPRRPKAP